jgi:hypothetical protein
LLGLVEGACQGSYPLADFNTSGAEYSISAAKYIYFFILVTGSPAYITAFTGG